MKRAALMLACVVLALLGTAGPASAHAVLIATQPSSLSVLPTAPHRVTLTFGEQVQVSPDGVRVLAPNGSRVDDGRAGHVTGRGDTVGVGVTATAQGTYTVAWRVVSADSHPVSGAFTYSVGHVSATTAVASPDHGSAAVTILYWTSRVLGYAGFALLVGSVGFVLLCWPDGRRERRVRELVRPGWLVLLIATVADALLQGPYGAGVGLDHLADARLLASTMALPLGTGLALRISLLAVAAPLVNGVLSGARRAVYGWLWAAVAVGLALTWSMSGHAAAGLQPGLALPVDVLHLSAMALWLGGLAVLVRAKPPDDAVGRFSRLAFTCVVVLVATGTYQSWRQLGRWRAFLDTDYGRLLLLKIAAVTVVLAAAWFSRRWVRTRAGSLRHPVLVETAGAVVVLALTAALVNSDPPRTPVVATTVAQSTSVRQSIPFDTGGPGGAGTLKVDVLPMTTGANIIYVTVLDPAGRRTDVAELDVALTLRTRGVGPLRFTLRHTGMTQGTYRSADTDIPLPGTWDMLITVRTSDFDETTVAVPVTVAG
ncbi:MAG TPA: copper resistance protein CopC [Pseudonocardiaceae bacterium]|nr:copper resistance protein CopC [Pseudonocardiaceae bacterium]